MPAPIYVFDAYGTLLDVHAAIARHRQSAGPDAERFSDIWRTKQLEYTWTLTLAGHYVNFWELTQRALDFAFARVPSVDRALRQKLLDAYFELDAYPDARPCLAALKKGGNATAILSNGSPNMLESVVEAQKLGGELDVVLSVDKVRRYKPRPEVYAMATEHFGAQPSEIIFVSSNRWDVMGASAYGFRTVWVNRAGNPDEYPDFRPKAVVKSLAELPAVAV